ncbi:hypothetical protein [Pollutibacter soli]|uniref:hypothetical protein n=1 Tax=Pollutibacter soli TaxID=3034157 RepID=UPI003013CA64
MQTGLVHLHNFLRWVIIILLLVSIFKSYAAWKSGRSFTAGDKRLWLFTMISAHVTLLLGIAQLLVGRFGILTTRVPEGVSVMKDKFFRFFWVEHPVLMLIAIVLITIGRGQSKKAIPDTVKFKKAFLFFLIALIVIFLAVPWPFRVEIGRPLFPGM